MGQHHTGGETDDEDHEGHTPCRAGGRRGPEGSTGAEAGRVPGASGSQSGRTRDETRGLTRLTRPRGDDGAAGRSSLEEWEPREPLSGSKLARLRRQEVRVWRSPGRESLPPRVPSGDDRGRVQGRRAEEGTRAEARSRNRAQAE